MLEHQLQDKPYPLSEAVRFKLGLYGQDPQNVGPTRKLRSAGTWVQIYNYIWPR